MENCPYPRCADNTPEDDPTYCEYQEMQAELVKQNREATARGEKPTFTTAKATLWELCIK